MAKHLIDNEKKLKDAIGHLLSVDRFSHDCESYHPRADEGYSALFPFHGARAFAHIFADAIDEYYFNFNASQGGIDKKHLPTLCELFEDISKTSFYVNAPYDCALLYVDGIVNKTRIIDWPTIARVEYNRHGKDEYSEESFLSMDYLAKYYKVQQKIDLVKKYIAEHGLYAELPCRITGEKIPQYDKVPLELMFEYGCGDARTTYDGTVKTIKCINYKDEKYAPQRLGGTMADIAKNEIALTPHIIEARNEGLKVWVEYVEKAIKHETKKEKRLRLEVDAITGGLNLSSGKQVAKYLVSQGVDVPRKEVTATALERADKWALKVRELEKEKGQLELWILENQCDGKPYKKHENRIKTIDKNLVEAKTKATEGRLGNFQTDAETLEMLAGKYDLPFLHKVTAAKRANKKVNTYYKNFLLYRDENDILHASINQNTAKTGRSSITAPALQTLHKEKWDGEDLEAFLIRKAIIANEPDELLLFADYKQQEMIVMLDQAEEMEVINKLLSGEFADFYLATSSTIRDKTGKEFERKIAKKISLSLAYGEGLDSLAKDLGVPKAEARGFKTTFFSVLPKLKKLDNDLKRQVKYYGKIHNPYGRVTYIPRGKEYTALNAFVQGMSADITKTAIINCCERFKAEGLKSKFALTIHDELVFRVKEYELEKVTSLIEEEMIAAYKHKHIKLGVDFEIAKRNSYGVSAWGEKVEYES